jgi:hypothetical protein
MYNKIIIFTTIAFLVASFTFLSIIESKQADLKSKAIWMLYFANPKDSSLDFTIENYLQNPSFHWEAYSNKTKIQEGDIAVDNGKTKTISLTIADIKNKRIIISVTDGNGNKKEIYKNLP